MIGLTSPSIFQHNCRPSGALGALTQKVGATDVSFRNTRPERIHQHHERCFCTLAMGVVLIVIGHSRPGLRKSRVRRKAGSSKALRNISKALALDEEESDDEERVERSGSSRPGCGQWYACRPCSSAQDLTGTDWREAITDPRHPSRKPFANHLLDLPADVAATVLESLREGSAGDISGFALKCEFSDRRIFSALKADARKLLTLVRRPEPVPPETIDSQVRLFLQQAWMRIMPQATNSKEKFRMARLFGKLLALVPEKRLCSGFQQSLAIWASRMPSAAVAPTKVGLAALRSEPTNAEVLAKQAAAVTSLQHNPEEQHVRAERLLNKLSKLLCGDSQAIKRQKDPGPPLEPSALAEALGAILSSDAGLLTNALPVFRFACEQLDAATIVKAGLWQLAQHSNPSLRILLLDAASLPQALAHAGSTGIRCWSQIGASTQDVLKACIQFAAQEIEFVDVRPWTELQTPLTSKAYAKKLRRYKALGMTWGPREVGRVSVKDLAAAPSAELLQLGVASADTTTYNQFAILNAQRKEQDQQRRQQEHSLIAKIAARLLRQLTLEEPQVLLNLSRVEAASLARCTGQHLGPAGEFLLGQLLDDVTRSPSNYTQVELFAFAQALGNDVMSRHSRRLADVILRRWPSLDYNQLVEDIKELPGLLLDAPQSLCEAIGAAYQIQNEVLVLTNVSQKGLVSIVEIWAGPQSQPFPSTLLPMLLAVLGAGMERFNDRQLLLAYRLGTSGIGSVDATIQNAKTLGKNACRSNSAAASRRGFQAIVQGLLQLGAAKPQEVHNLVRTGLERRVRASLSGQIAPLHLSVAIAIAKGETPVPCRSGSLLWSGLVASIHAQLTSPEQLDLFCQTSPDKDVWDAVLKLCHNTLLSLELQIRRPLTEDATF
eukprot:TRINITY_DN42415_c0_g1_i1.p1 TRINITY_DN42415_c0_g1~~TRINITY_DN42415_c0_g1_i1.p1  ORF type:complete len:891 (+),score=120.37 TRINITY_DN42415_c0_g1_i1:160-2832(+)